MGDPVVQLCLRLYLSQTLILDCRVCLFHNSQVLFCFVEISKSRVDHSCKNYCNLIGQSKYFKSCQ